MNITNNDLENQLTVNHKEVTDRLNTIENQVKLTNGRVKELERKEIGRDAVDIYKAAQTNDHRWDVTTVISVIVALASIIGALWWTASQH
jgi:hypothetical protein